MQPGSYICITLLFIIPFQFYLKWHSTGMVDSVCFPLNRAVQLQLLSSAASLNTGLEFSVCLWKSVLVIVLSVKYHHQICSAKRKYISKMRSVTFGQHVTLHLGLQSERASFFLVLLLISALAGTRCFIELVAL